MLWASRSLKLAYHCNTVCFPKCGSIIYVRTPRTQTSTVTFEFSRGDSPNADPEHACVRGHNSSTATVSALLRRDIEAFQGLNGFLIVHVYAFETKNTCSLPTIRISHGQENVETPKHHTETPKYRDRNTAIHSEHCHPLLEIPFRNTETLFRE